MRKVILQHVTSEQSKLFDISRPINQKYARNLGFDYISNCIRRCPERSIYWEKIAYLIEMLPTLEEGTFVVWEDADSINVKEESLENALPNGEIFGMVQNRAGVNGNQLINWYNAGVMVMINCPEVRDFLNRVWKRTEETDESAIVAELKLNGWVVGGGKYIYSIDAKWNQWANNTNVCSDPVIKSFHGILPNKKLSAIQEFLKSHSIA